jgi:hypothetical protein
LQSIMAKWEKEQQSSERKHNRGQETSALTGLAQPRIREQTCHYEPMSASKQISRSMGSQQVGSWPISFHPLYIRQRLSTQGQKSARVGLGTFARGPARYRWSASSVSWTTILGSSGSSLHAAISLCWPNSSVGVASKCERRYYDRSAKPSTAPSRAI